MLTPAMKMSPAKALKVPMHENVVNLPQGPQAHHPAVVQVEINDLVENVYLDPAMGPLMYNFDGTIIYKKEEGWRTGNASRRIVDWKDMEPTKKHVLLIQVARTNAAHRAQQGGKDIWRKARHSWGITQLDEENLTP
eukprot:gnl/TRDRNA2_/TRDRNA2_44916_c0_seq1.p2 gnl/TRDRNA2_/TRDRNA2_44916_c0~~gnl/TRDRNA2_/TRDRNA2_44916_c0_seq1.p2  ORF type:complete len:137 (+),score=31.25 gnl/TRDRNA2_/TRDRNA2_44916_c0_seq1:88-498(+)